MLPSVTDVANSSLKECPLCGGSMRLKRSQTETHVPGNSKPSVRRTAEWVCPECDYFEDVEDGND